MQVSGTLASDAGPIGLAPDAARSTDRRSAANALAASAWLAAAAAIIAISLAPFLVVDVPAVADYPNHLARFYVLAHPHDPILSKMYAPHWAVLPNLGTDVLGWALLSFLPPHVGGRILLAASLVAPLAGTVLYARAAFGRWTWWSLGAGVIAYNAIFFLGFMNFLLGLGVGLAGAAAWRLLRRKGRSRAAMAAGAAIGLVAFFCHLLGFGLFALLIAAQEIEPLLGLWRRRQLSWRAAANAAALLAVPLLPTVALYVITHHPVGVGDLVFWKWGDKALVCFTPFMTYSLVATAVTAIIVIGSAIVVTRGASWATGDRLALVGIVIAYIAAPYAAGGGAYVDTRIPVMATLLLFAGVSPRPAPRVAIGIAVAFALLISGRSALVSANWLGHARDLAELRTELTAVPPGAKVLPAYIDLPSFEPRPDGRQLPGFVRLDTHMAAVAVIERRAFWPLLFADPNQQPLVVRAPYDRIAPPLTGATPWRNLLDDPAAPANIRKFGYLLDWRTQYDFVLSFGPPPKTIPAGLTLVQAGKESSLYRIAKAPSSPLGRG